LFEYVCHIFLLPVRKALLCGRCGGEATPALDYPVPGPGERALHRVLR